MKERRLAARIKTSIAVDYWELFKTDVLGGVEKATIVDLSLVGCCLFVPKEPALNINNRIKLLFMLDNDNHTKIEREALVCNVRGNYIRCRFAPQPQGSEPDFISYINAHLLQNIGGK
ncbi:MAG: PilZ domain-containing protein, partial [Syntrophales bacterium]